MKLYDKYFFIVWFCMTGFFAIPGYRKPVVMWAVTINNAYIFRLLFNKSAVYSV